MLIKSTNAELHMTLGELPVFSHKSYPKGLAAAPNALPIGSGPSRFVRADPTSQSEYRRDEAYWAQNLPTRKGMYNFDTVRFKYYRDDSVRIEGIKGGQYDFVQENIARNWMNQDEKAARALLYRIGAQRFIDRVLIAWARSREGAADAHWKRLAELPQRWNAPVFPLKAADVARLRADYEKRYEAQFGLRIADVPVEFLTWSVSVSIP